MLRYKALYGQFSLDKPLALKAGSTVCWIPPLYFSRVYSLSLLCPKIPDLIMTFLLSSSVTTSFFQIFFLRHTFLLLFRKMRKCARFALISTRHFRREINFANGPWSAYIVPGRNSETTEISRGAAAWQRLREWGASLRSNSRNLPQSFENCNWRARQQQKTTNDHCSTVFS